MAKTWGEVWYRRLFPESEIRGKCDRVLLNSLGAEIKDRARPDVRTMVDDAQGGVGQHIHLEMQPAGPGLADAMRILNLQKDPVAA